MNQSTNTSSLLRSAGATVSSKDHKAAPTQGPSTRVEGVYLVSRGVAIVLVFAAAVWIASQIMDLSNALKNVIVIGFVVLLVSLWHVLSGTLKATIGRSWFEIPSWMRLVYLVLAVPTFLAGGALVLAFILTSIQQ